MKYVGITQKEADKKILEYGYNEIKDVNRVSSLKILFRQVKHNFIFYLLFVAMVVSFFVGKDITGYVILFVILLVVFTGFFQEYKAEKAIEKLKEMVTPLSIVIRDGEEKEILTRELVLGDFVVLHTGEKIPADCVIINEKNLSVNEALLTGESDSVRKEATINFDSPKKENLLFAGSFIVEGKCLAKVIFTGMNTKFGKIASLISKAEKELPLQNKINLISKYMAFIGIFMAILTGLIILFQNNFSKDVVIDVLILVIAISVSSFPEGFPVVLITTLSSGAYRMAKKNAIVNRMSIIETLGETTIICTDKTGTITKGEMSVRKIFSNNKFLEVTGVGYVKEGDFLDSGRKIDLKRNNTLNLLLKTSVACNDANIKRNSQSNSFDVLGTPTEVALLVMGSKAEIYSEDIGERIDEIPFSSERKMMSVLYKGEKDNFIYSKGALEFILDKCKFIQRDDGVYRILERDKRRIIEEKQKFASSSLRTLAFAYSKTNSKSIDGDEELIFLGFVGMEDSPREGVKEALIRCKDAGIKIKMITGDDKETAISIANEIGLEKGRVMEGYELDRLTDEQLYNIIKSVVIFSRVKPEHKLRIVKALKEHGEIVTMTGDGVNDAPALKEAHIGVAMGKNGTDVSKSVADLILKDDNFVTLVDAIKEGRTIFGNIRKFVSYQLSCNFAELMILFIGVLLVPFFGWPFPLLLALQILFMNIVTDNLPAITLGLNKSSEDIMKQKPRKNVNILNRNYLKLLIFNGSLMASFVLVIFYFTFNILGQVIPDARTTALIALIVIEIAAAFNFRSLRKETLNRSLLVNPYLFGASIISLMATVLIVYTPINSVFGTTHIPFIDWVFAFGFGFLIILIFDILKRINNKKHFIDFN